MASDEQMSRGSHTRRWRGDRATWINSYRKYDFPVTTYKVGPDGRRQVIKTTDR
ncbi:hypothetical protein C9F11_10065 [Streptomyces sp. YIM 121038]|nr:hypothetical protein C9F11_10065 [Streptomyces sp. YIM 121038]